MPELPDHNAPTYHFLLGPKPSQVNQADRRILVDAPSRFIELQQEPSDKALELPEFTFAYRYPAVEPVRRDQLAEPGVIIATIGWEPPGSVRKRIDGSWMNYYSRYKVRRPDQYGLNVATGDDLLDTSQLFYSIEQEVLIECNSVKGEPLRGCHLMKKLSDYSVLELRFPADLLTDWRDLVSAASRIVVIHNK